MLHAFGYVCAFIFSEDRFLMEEQILLLSLFLYVLNPPFQHDLNIKGQISTNWKLRSRQVHACPLFHTFSWFPQTNWLIGTCAYMFPLTCKISFCEAHPLIFENFYPCHPKPGSRWLLLLSYICLQLQRSKGMKSPDHLIYANEICLIKRE